MGNLQAIRKAAVHDPRIAASMSNIEKVLTESRKDMADDDSTTYASSKQVEAVKAQKITFYYGDQVIGEVKFTKVGTRDEKIARCKKLLMKQELQKDKNSSVGQKLFSPFCNFKIV